MVPSKFDTDCAVNELLNYSKKVITKINGLKNCDDKVKTMQALIFAGMVSYYGLENLKEIYDTFHQTNLIFSDEPVVEVLSKKTEINVEFLNMLRQTNPEAYLEEAFLMNCNNINIRRNIYVFDDPYCPLDILYENTIHEYNHIVNSINNNIVDIGGKPFARLGLAYRELFSGCSDYLILEESINVLQSAEIMEHILAFLRFNIEDSDISAVLNEMRYVTGRKRKGRGYELTVPLIRELYENCKFNLVLKKRRIDGQINFIKEEFDAHTFDGALNRLACCCENIGVGCSNVDIDLESKNACGIVKQYVRR